MEKCHTSKWPKKDGYLGLSPLKKELWAPTSKHISMDFFGIRPPGLQRSDDSNSKPQWQAGQTSRDTAQNLSKKGWKKKHYPESPRRPSKLFYGTSIAGRLPPPTPPAETTLLWAERNTWRQIYQDMADG